MSTRTSVRFKEAAALATQIEAAVTLASAFLRALKEVSDLIVGENEALHVERVKCLRLFDRFTLLPELVLIFRYKACLVDV